MTDWPALIAEIKTGYFKSQGRLLSDYKLGLMVGADAKTIDRIATGLNRDPRDSIARGLREQHKIFSGNPSIVPCGTFSAKA